MPRPTPRLPILAAAPPAPAIRRLATALAVALPLLAGGACVHNPEQDLARQRARIQQLEATLSEAELALRVQRDRADHLERRLETLSQDLRVAGQSLISIESGLKGSHSRADAVAALAEARILVQRSAGRNPWRPDLLTSARERLEEADRHVAAGNFGSAVFFASRARRISEQLIEEERELSRATNVLEVRVGKVNLRRGPSTAHPIVGVLDQDTPLYGEGTEQAWQRVRTLDGRIGWVHRSMLAAR